MISLRWISGFLIVGEGRHLRTEFALSTVARVIALCRGVYSQEFLHSQAGDTGLGFVTTCHSAESAPSKGVWGHAPHRKFLYFRLL